MALWLRRDIAVGHPCAIDAILVKAGIASSLSDARRHIAAQSVYLNNEKLIPPEKDFLPVLIVADVRADDYVALGIREDAGENSMAQ